MLTERLSGEFKLDNTIIYLNHAAVGVWPTRTSQVVCAFAEENQRQGAADYPKWLKTEQQLRGQLQCLLNAPSSDDIALVKNTSEALSFVAYGLPWQPGDQVLTLAEEFPSNRVVWQSLQARGVETQLVSLQQHSDTPEEAVIAAMTPRTRLLSVSSVQYASGYRLNLEKLGAACRQRGILFCVDAIQSLGVVPMDVQAIHADFVMADGHKWMLGPEGVAVFYSRTEAREQLALTQYGWHMLEHMHDFDNPDWQIASSARRFECGSPNMLGIHALHASLGLLLSIGIDSVQKLVSERVHFLHELVLQHPALSLLSSAQPERTAGIVTFRVNNHNMQDIHQSLMQTGVICALRGGGIRFSPHFYTPMENLQQAFSILDELLRH